MLARGLVRLTRLVGLGHLIDALRDCASLDEQRALVRQYAGAQRRLCRMCRALIPLICPLAGVPASQLALGHVHIFEDIIERVFMRTCIANDNYLWYGYLYGCYSKENCPRYLRPENFHALREALPRVSVRTGLLHEVASEFADGYFSAMILLDHMDWLEPAQVHAEWCVLARKLDPERGRVLWRSFAFEQAVPLLAPLHYHPARVRAAEALFAERVGSYNSTHLATLPRGLTFSAPPAALAEPGGVSAAARLFYGRLPRLAGSTWADVALGDADGALGAQLGPLAPALAPFSRVHVLLRRAEDVGRVRDSAKSCGLRLRDEGGPPRRDHGMPRRRASGANGHANGAGDENGHTCGANGHCERGGASDACGGTLSVHELGDFLADAGAEADLLTLSALGSVESRADGPVEAARAALRLAKSGAVVAALCALPGRAERARVGAGDGDCALLSGSAMLAALREATTQLSLVAGGGTRAEPAHFVYIGRRHGPCEARSEASVAVRP